ncbi:MAG: efflux RND transporter periplasmic adaptor subunit [Azospirillum brasilense]|nr:MAG: efflux RND transporter periplasmic adaptor subunit [Azospirillum brasilense]
MRPVFQRFPRKRRYLVAGFILLPALLLWAPWSDGSAGKTAYEYLPVTRTSIEESVTAQGKLEPKEFVDVGAQVSGQLKKLHVEIGDVVKKGELIAEIDPQIYNARVEADEARLKTLRAQLAEQQANVEFAQSVYNRNSKLVKADAVSKEVLQDSLKEYKAAQARTNSFKAQIEEAESTLRGDRANLGFTKIYAPIDGTVVSQTSKEGQTLNANQLAPVIVQVANLDTMTVRAQVAEADVPRLKEGMPVYFTILGSERRWDSTLRQLLPSPDATVLDVVLYNALVDVQNSDHALMTGMSTQMFFQLGSATDTLSIPTRALGKKLPAAPGEGETYEVLVKKGNDVVPTPVRIGLMSRTQAQVLSGLTETDMVAIATAEATGGASGAAARRGPRI